MMVNIFYSNRVSVKTKTKVLIRLHRGNAISQTVRYLEISQNLAHLEGDSHKKFKSHRFSGFYEEINKSHTVVVFTSFLH